MAELTKEQLTSVQQIFTRAGYTPTEETIRAAAPYLQLPWNAATEEEAKRYRTVYRDTLVKPALQLVAEITALDDFLVSRNAKRLPKPVEPPNPRRVVSALIHDGINNWETDFVIADKILAALDGVK